MVRIRLRIRIARRRSLTDCLIIYNINPLSPHDAFKHNFKSLKTDLIFLFRMNIAMKLIDQYMTIFFNFSSTSSHLHPLQVENCDSNSRLVVDEDDNGKFRLERVNRQSVGDCNVRRNYWILFSTKSKSCSWVTVISAKLYSNFY